MYKFKDSVLCRIKDYMVHDFVKMGVAGDSAREAMDSIVYRSTDPRRYFKTEQEALEFAEKLANKKEPYYG